MSKTLVRLPMNPREDAEVLSTGKFPALSRPPLEYIPQRCETCSFWARNKYKRVSAKRWDGPHCAKCLHPAKQWRIAYATKDRSGPAVIPDVITGINYSCEHWTHHG